MGSLGRTAVEGTVEYYWDQAVRIRLAAEQATIKDIRDELFKIAAAFERLATERSKHPVR